MLYLLSVLLLALGCDGVLGSEKRLDKCGVCDGDNSTCHIISGIYTRRHLPYGYSRVTTIPRGACGINITEMAPSTNLLAVRVHRGRFIINGRSSPAVSRTVQAAGTVFTYQHRPRTAGDTTTPPETIQADGPLNTSIDILVLKKSENRGIIYSYTVPAFAANHTSRRRHHRHRQHTTTTSNPLFDLAQGDEAQHSASFREYLQRLRQRQRQDASRSSPSSRRQSSESTGRVSNTERKSTEASEDQASEADERSTGVGRSRAGSHLGVQNPAPAVAGSYNPSYTSRLTHAQQPYYVPPSYSQPAVQSQQQSRQYSSRYSQQHNSRQRTQAVAPSSQRQQYVPSSQRQQYVPSYRQPSAQRLAQSGARGVPQGQQYVARQGQTSTHQRGHYRQGQPSTPQRAPYGQVGYQGYAPQSPAYGYPRTGYPQSAQGGAYPQSGYQQGAYPVSGYQQPYGYYQGSGVPQGRVRGPINDQIPRHHGRHRQGSRQIGNVDSGSEYSWRITGFTGCSQSCGGGVENTSVVCVKGDTLAIVTDANCDNALKPETQTVPCNNRPCPPSWEVGSWGECSTSCDPGDQTRTVLCQQRISDTTQITLPANSCRNQPRPDGTKPCNEDSPCIKWRLGEWGKCSADCGRGQRSREVVCIRADNTSLAENMCTENKPATSEVCDMGSCAKKWFHTAWPDACSSRCGEGLMMRRVHCGDEERSCSNMRPPSSRKRCSAEVPCGGQWFTADWGQCSVTCGEGVERRDVVCVRKSGRLLTIVEEENCDSEERPDSQRTCSNAACPPQWYITEWSQCSRSCGTGVMTRELKCLDDDEQVSFECGARPRSRQSCNAEACPQRRRRPHHHSPARSQSSDTCEDNYRNCQLVVQARLCNFAHYNTICCATCRSQSQERITGSTPPTT